MSFRRTVSVSMKSLLLGVAGAAGLEKAEFLVGLEVGGAEVSRTSPRVMSCGLVEEREMWDNNMFDRRL